MEVRYWKKKLPKWNPNGKKKLLRIVYPNWHRRAHSMDTQQMRAEQRLICESRQLQTAAELAAHLLRRRMAIMQLRVSVVQVLRKQLGQSCAKGYHLQYQRMPGVPALPQASRT